MPAPADRRYLGRREEQAGPGDVFVIDSNGRSRELNPRNDVRNHSPDGFQWGYGGSGPAQLALALCCDVLGDVERARRVYQDFKFRTVARITGDTWEMSAGGIMVEIEAIETARADA